LASGAKEPGSFDGGFPAGARTLWRLTPFNIHSRKRPRAANISRKPCPCGYLDRHAQERASATEMILIGTASNADEKPFTLESKERAFAPPPEQQHHEETGTTS
jgi:hypothetical protein